MSDATSDGIEGATVRLYRCDELAATLVTSTTTNGQGAYGFTSLAGPKWYFVQAMLTGPLANMTTSQGTANPSALIDVGAGATGVVLSFR
ncbi:MAG: SdrD B-like domain-containing protein [Ardenticatenales bacterium]